MSRLMLVTLCGFLSLWLGQVQAQAQRVAYVNIPQVLLSMPERTQVENAIRQFEQEQQRRVGTFQERADRTYRQYQQQSASLSPEIRAEREQDLLRLRDELNQLRADAQRAMDAKRLELQSRVMDKIRNAVAAVAKANGYAYVLSDTEVLAYADLQFDITALVKQAVNSR